MALYIKYIRYATLTIIPKLTHITIIGINILITLLILTNTVLLTPTRTINVIKFTFTLPGIVIIETFELILKNKIII